LMLLRSWPGSCVGGLNQGAYFNKPKPPGELGVFIHFVPEIPVSVATKLGRMPICHLWHPKPGAKQSQSNRK